MPDASFSFADLAPRDRYKLLAGTVVPRPIALVGSIDAEGRVNAAPYSFFNVFSEDPALVVLGLQHHPDLRAKDTNRNIRENGEFVVHLVDQPLAEAMNVCATDFPPGVSEVAVAGLTLAPSVAIGCPRIAEAPVALECRRTLMLTFGPGRDLLVGEVVHLHARAGIVDPASLYIDIEAYQPVGRLFGDLYWRGGEVYAMPRRRADEWEHDPDGNGLPRLRTC